MRIITLSALLFAAALGACASKTARQDDSSYTWSAPPVTLRHAPGATASANMPANTAIGYVNARRAEAGLPPIATDAGLAAAAFDHARYLALNHVGTHEEREGLAGFTGTDILTRVRLHTQAHSASEVLALIGGAQHAASPVAHIFASPYHRGALLFDWARAGESVMTGASAIAVIDFADIAPSLADNELIAWPHDGQTHVPTAWENNEQPDPMGANSGYHGKMLGYPVTLSGGPNAHIELQSVELREARGASVPCRIAPLTAADAARNTAICTPLQPLDAATRYTVRARGTLRQLSSRTRFDLTWTFTTMDVQHPYARQAPSTFPDSLSPPIRRSEGELAFRQTN